jgi:hypothetical protein
MFALMDRWGKTLDEVLAMQAQLVYDILLHDFERSMYQRDLDKQIQQLQKKK